MQMMNWKSVYTQYEKRTDEELHDPEYEKKTQSIDTKIVN